MVQDKARMANIRNRIKRATSIRPSWYLVDDIYKLNLLAKYAKRNCYDVVDLTDENYKTIKEGANGKWYSASATPFQMYSFKYVWG